METTGKLLIIDDNKDVLSALEILLDEEFEEVICLSNPNQIPNILHTKFPDVVLLDMNFTSKVNTGNEGIYWLDQIKKINQNIEVIMFTAFGDVHLAVKAMKLGATDFILKPWDNDKMLATLKAAFKISLTQKEKSKLIIQNEYLSEEISNQHNLFLGQSKPFKQLMNTIKKVAPTDASVLITGENGTGKSVLAREIHKQSNRSKETFVTVDLGSISESLFESELFGYKKGAFTDAKEDKIGRLQSAHGGTLFLDEIGNLSLDLQAKLLSAIQERKITPLGSNTAIEIDIRLITATNKSIDDLISTQNFREDLLYRINTISLEMPPLRDRKEDFTLLTDYFLKKFTTKYKRTNLKADASFHKALLDHNYPGNIRELEHTIEKCVILCQEERLDAKDVTFKKSINPQQISGSLEEIEKVAILNAIDKHNGNMIRAAKELNITRQTIYNKMKKYGL